MILNQVEYIHFDPCPVFIFCRALNTYRVAEIPGLAGVSFVR